ncbi:MAG: hypothetical protein IJJ38_00750 [Lachnospiraceae bacterium]|nr:hypothetical protein [Lachnospiraceae bacterium]
MRSYNEELKEVMRRGAQWKEHEELKRKVKAEAFSVCICVILFVTAVFYLPAVSQTEHTSASYGYGSLILDASFLGYVVVGLLAFVLGILITLLCLHLREMKRRDL